MTYIRNTSNNRYTTVLGIDHRGSQEKSFYLNIGPETGQELEDCTIDYIATNQTIKQTRKSESAVQEAEREGSLRDSLIERLDKIARGKE